MVRKLPESIANVGTMWARTAPATTSRMLQQKNLLFTEAGAGRDRAVVAESDTRHPSLAPGQRKPASPTCPLSAFSRQAAC
ncbi:MAG TPA: hypothetical protein VJW77_15045 [Terriglobia bacterium]|nr:hypothetical protein [Terriglobia bacterium]